jgi:hypothetical protein
MSAVSQKSFAAGEIAPALYARVDVSKYAIGLRTCRNFIVMRHGGATNRPGTKFVGEVYDSSKNVRLIPFIVSSTSAYVLEFGDLTLKVIQSGAYTISQTMTITGITNANPGVVTYSGSDLSNGDEVTITGVVGALATNINGRNFKAANVNTVANTFELTTMAGANFNTTSLGAYSSAGTVSVLFKIASPYAVADIPELRFTQNGTTMTIVHPSYAPRELSSAFAFSTITFAPITAAPVTVSNNGAGGTTTEWVVTRVNLETGEESLASSSTGSSATPSSGSPITVSWASPGAFTAPPFSGSITPTAAYRVYKKKHGIYGLIGEAQTTAFVDDGITADVTIFPPIARNPFASSSNYPGAVAFHQSRIFYAASTNNPGSIWASRIGLFPNFTEDSIIADDNAVTFGLAGDRVQKITHLLKLGTLVSFTSDSEWSINGNAAGIITPEEVNPKQYSQHGSGKLMPIVAGINALFVQGRQNIVRDLAFDYETDGYKGNDLTIFSAHMFDGYTLRDWTYQQVPHSIVWAVRSDGTLLGLTYVREQELIAWHRHDFQGETVEQVCAIPESTEDALYIVVKRTINGATKRYVERMQTRNISDIEDAIFMDSALTYDGTNAGATTMTLSGGTTWTNGELLTLTASASYFASTDVGNRIDITSTTGDVLRCVIMAYTSATVVTVNPQKNVPANLRSTARATWAKAVDQVTGLWHLEGEDVSVLGDGFVVAHPNNPDYDVLLPVTNGAITLPHPYSVIQVGLPIIADMETLDIDQAQGESLANKKKLINQVTAFVQNSRGLWVGPTPPTDDDDDPLENLTELKIRDSEDYDEPVSLATDNVEISTAGEWNSNGRVFIRQVDPLPLTVLSVTPTGFVPYQK